MRKEKGGDYVVAIPSYRRSVLVCKKTLATLFGKSQEEKGVAENKVYVFVANKQEMVEYTKKVKEVYPDVHIVLGKKGITSQRRFIVSYFDEGQCIVSMDDDIHGMYKKEGDRLKKMTPSEISTFFVEAFRDLRERALYLWGVYPVANAFFMKREPITTNLRFIIGTCYGFINRPKETSIVPTLEEKEDYEMSILYYVKDGGVLRFNDITFKTRFHNPEGGLGCLTPERFAANEAAAAELKLKWPNMGYIWHRKNGMAEWRFYTNAPRSGS